MHPTKPQSLARLIILVAVPCLMVAGCASQVAGTAKYPADYEPAPSSGVTRLQAWQDAEALAALDPGRLTVIGTGASMRPVYGDHTMLVLQKVSFAELTAGMTVAYRNGVGRVVVHTLVSLDEGGWRAAGLNNAAEDQGRVTPDNLIGVVYASFAHDAVQ